MIHLKRLGLMVIACVAVVSSSLLSQSILPADTSGVEYWVTFMDNFGNSNISQMRLYAAAGQPTSLDITYTATGQTMTVPILMADVPVEININTLYGATAELNAGDQGVSSKSFHVVAKNRITLYGSSVRSASGDAFLALPKDILTERYIVLAYPAGYVSRNAQYDMPSEFAIIATEDNTTIRITPPIGVNLNGLPDVTFAVLLNKGQVYFAQTPFNQRQDVTGTEILSDKPIAVFGGNRRADVPSGSGVSRDHLCEQLPPLDAWGSEVIIAPLFPINPSSPLNAVIRVLPAFDNTEWMLNGASQPTLQHAQPFSFSISNTPFVVSADQPVLVGLYEHSSGTSQGIDNTGDPFMVCMPPKEQFDSIYAFQSIIDTMQFKQHFINVIVPDNHTGTLRLDAKALTGINFQHIQGTNYSYAQISVSPGAHYIAADTGFGLYVYGYGPVNSYGYLGGMLFRKLVTDFFPPELLTTVGCSSISGIAYDSRITDSGMDSCTVSSSVNANVNVLPFVPQADTVYFSATLLDPYQDGYVSFRISDSAHHKRIYSSGIPGFTLRSAGMNGNTPIQADTVLSFNGKTVCSSVVIENYGKYPHTFSSASFGADSTRITIISPLPRTLAPGAKDTVRFCITVPNDTMFMAQLSIADTCLKRSVLNVPVLSIIDTIPPSIFRPKPCGNTYTLTFSDSGGTGITNITVDTIANGNISFDPPLNTLPAQSVRGLISWIDTKQDLIYRITFTDRTGNSVVIHDTLSSTFLLAAIDPHLDTVGIRIGKDWMMDTLALGMKRCDSITISNYGRFPVTIENASFLGNQLFSVPPGQFPIALPANASQKIWVCMSGEHNEAQFDTLVITGDCGLQELVAVQAPVRGLTGYGNDICNSRLQLSIFAASKRTFLTTPIPNPVRSTTATVDIGLHTNQSVSIELRDLNSIRVAAMVNDVPLPAGIHRLDLNTSNLPNGAYMIVMRTSEGKVYVQKMLVGR